jgi:putative ABC transport system permease protein
LVIACFNFINLATARSFRRAKEIGVRKVMVAGRRQIITQFMLETIFLSNYCCVPGRNVTMLLLPMVNQFTQKNQIAF